MAVSRHSDHFILAKNKYLPIHSQRSSLNTNIVLSGSSLQDREKHFIAPNVMQMNSSYVIFSQNTDLFESLGNMLSRNGYIVKLVNFQDTKNSDAYNPFMHIRNHSDVFMLVDYLFDQFNFTDDLFTTASERDAARSLVLSIVFFLHSECINEDLNLFNVIKLLSCAVADEDHGDIDSTLDILVKDVASRESEHICVQYYNYFKSTLSIAKSRMIVDVLHNSFTELCSCNSEDFISSDTLQLDMFSSETIALFVVNSGHEQQYWLERLFQIQLFADLLSQRPKSHVFLFLNGWQSTRIFSEFDRKIAMFNSHNLSCVVMLDDEVGFLKKYGDLGQRVIRACDNYVFYGSSDIDLCNLAAARLKNNRVTGTRLRSLSHEKCVLISGNKAGIYNKFPLAKHPQYKDTVFSGNSALEYRFKGRKKVNPESIPIDKYLELADIPERDGDARIRRVYTPRPLPPQLSGLSLFTKSPNEELTNEFYSMYSMEDSFEDSSKQFDDELSQIISSVPEYEPDASVWEIGNIKNSSIVARIINEEDEVCLELLGSGATLNFTKEDAPWYSKFHLKITKVVVSDGIEELGDYLFYGLACLREVSLGEKVYYLGKSLFENCFALEQVNFNSSPTHLTYPNAKAKVGDRCFAYCEKLKFITLPDVIKSIGCRAFWECSSLVSFSASNQVTFDNPYDCFHYCPVLKDFHISNMDKCLENIPEYIITFLNKQGLSFEFDDISKYANRQYTEVRHSWYHKSTKVIYFNPFSVEQKITSSLSESVGEFLFDFFGLYDDKLLSELYLKDRFELYQYALAWNRDKREIDRIFSNSKNLFIDLYHFTYYDHISVPVLRTNISSFKEFVFAVNSWVNAENMSSIFVEAFTSAFGGKKEGSYRYKEIKTILNEHANLNLSVPKLKKWLTYMNEEGLLCVDLGDSQKKTVISLPSTEDSNSDAESELLSNT